MHTRTWTLLLAAGGLALVTWQWQRLQASHIDHAPIRRAAEVREADIVFYQARVARDPYGARDRALLAALYLDRARTTGSERDLRHAEALARASSASRRAHNGAAAAVLTGTLMAQHRFGEAWMVMEPIVRADSADLVARATLGEIALELGRYPEADRLLAPLARFRFQPAVGTRYARWLEMSGRSGEARELLQRLQADRRLGFRVSDEELAWYDLRLGQLAVRHGRRDAAAAAWRAGLTRLPGDPRFLAALGRLALDRGDPDSARALAERALEARYDPSTLVLLAEVARAQGDTSAGDDYSRGVEAALAGSTSGFHRDWALHLLDQGRRVHAIRELALAELTRRRDAYSLDLAAWALYRDGQVSRAAGLARAAVTRGIEDPELYRHAGEILRASGDSTTAARHLAAAARLRAGLTP